MLDGAGYVKTYPKRATQVYINNNDPSFSDAVFGNNVVCDASPGCKKAVE